MSNRRRCWLMLALVGSLAGCGTGGQPEVEGGAAHAKPGSPPPLAELLKQPRAELVKRTDELVAEIKTREEGRARGTVKFALLPDWNPPRTIPVFQEAKYVPEVGLSLPPYAEAKELDKDPELAVHYARFGDREAAIQLAGRATPRIEQFAGGANYPVEWTRLAALQIYSLEQRIATGDREALKDLLAWRRQLEEVLDDPAKKGWLGWSLLPRGRRTVEQAAAAWRAKNQTAPAELAEAALAKWNLPGEPPSIERSKKYWLEALRTPGEGRALSASPVKRGLDFLCLPLPEEAAEAALFFFNRQDQLEQVIVTYTPRVTQQYARAVELAGELANWTPPEPRDDRLCLQRWPGLTVESQLGPAGSVPGGWMRVLWETKPEPESLPRALGSVHLDRSFDENRLLLTPNVLGTSITIQQPELLAKANNPLPKLKLASITISRPEDEDYLEEARFHWNGAMAVDQLALPLLAQLGPGRWSFEAFNSAQGLPAHFQIAWEDAKTQTLLRVPYDRQTVEAVHRDRRELAQAAERRSAVSALGEAERRQRLEAGKPIQRLARKLEQLPLGTDRATILKYLPQGQSVFKRDLPDGILVANNTTPGKDQTHLVRQIVVRFDSKDRLFWVRAQYEGVAGKTKKDSAWAQQLLNSWRTQGGAVAPARAPFKERTADLPKPTPAPSLYRWKDDLTEVTYLSDSGGVEITVQERPSSQEKLAPLVYLPRGPEGVLAGLTLGAARSDLQAKLPTKPTEEGAYLLGVPDDRPYDVVLVWFDKDKVQRIAARYRQADPPKTTPADMEKALYARWGAELRTVGWPTRRDASPQGPIQAFTWFDDQTRYRLYWAENDKSPPRLWSEWRNDR